LWKNSKKKGQSITIEVVLDKQIIEGGDGIALGKVLALAGKRRV
jgi:hypothetical protein